MAQDRAGHSPQTMRSLWLLPLDPNSPTLPQIHLQVLQKPQENSGHRQKMGSALMQPQVPASLICLCVPAPTFITSAQHLQSQPNIYNHSSEQGTALLTQEQEFWDKWDLSVPLDIPFNVQSISTSIWLKNKKSSS